MSEGNSNTYLLETPAGNILINSGMGYKAPVHERNFQELGNAEPIFPYKYPALFSVTAAFVE